jgi:hypothetical protein
VNVLLEASDQLVSCEFCHGFGDVANCEAQKSRIRTSARTQLKVPEDLAELRDIAEVRWLCKV